MAKSQCDQTTIQSLIQLATPVLIQTQKEYDAMTKEEKKKKRGRKFQIPDWVIALLIMIVLLKKKKTKTAQFTYLSENRSWIEPLLQGEAMPKRTAYFDRYRKAYEFLQKAIHVQGLLAVSEGIVDPSEMAVDKSLIPSRGPLWHAKDRENNMIPQGLHGVDVESEWGYSKHDGWVQGYCYEVVVSAAYGTVVFPMIASADAANAKETKTFVEKIDLLHERTRFVCADAGYDSNEIGEKIEWHANEAKRTGCRFLGVQRKAPKTSKKKREKRKTEPRQTAKQKQIFRTSPCPSKVFGDIWRSEGLRPSRKNGRTVQ